MAFVKMMGYQVYILRGLTVTTVVVGLSLTAIVWLMQALRLVDYIVNQGISIPLFLELRGLLIPNVVFFVLPVAAFIAVLFFYNKLKNDSELSVLHAVGLSRMQLAKPVIVLCIGCTALCYLLTLYIMPATTREYRNMQFFLRNNYVSVMLQEGVFATPTDKLMVYIRERESSTRLKGVLVHDMRDPKATVTMMAENATIVDTSTGPQFLLEHGNRQEMKNGRLSFLSFDSTPLDMSSFAKDNADRREDVRELSVFELLTRAGNGSIPEKERKRGLAEAHQRLTWPLLALCLPLFAVAMLLSAEHNRRLRIRRNLSVVIAAAAIIFIAVSMRSMITDSPALAPLAYLWPMLPLVAAAFLLLERASSPAAAFESRLK